MATPFTENDYGLYGLFAESYIMATVLGVALAPKFMWWLSVPIAIVTTTLPIFTVRTALQVLDYGSRLSREWTNKTPSAQERSLSHIFGHADVKGISGLDEKIELSLKDVDIVRVDKTLTNDNKLVSLSYLFDRKTQAKDRASGYKKLVGKLVENTVNRPGEYQEQYIRFTDPKSNQSAFFEVARIDSVDHKDENSVVIENDSRLHPLTRHLNQEKRYFAVKAVSEEKAKRLQQLRLR